MSPTYYAIAVAAEQKYDRGGACVRGCEAADYPCETSTCEGQKLEGLSPPSPPGSTALVRL